MPIPPRRRLRVVALAFAASTLALAVLLALTWLHLFRLGTTVDSLRNDLTRMKRAPNSSGDQAVSRLRYALELPDGGDLFPALAATEAGYRPLAKLRITNPGAQPVLQAVSAQIPGWSLRAEQTIVLAAGETRELAIRPELLAEAFLNDEPRRAVLEVRAGGPQTGAAFAEKRELRLRGGAEIEWGQGFANAGLSARWVTPHDPAVLELVSRARRHVPRGRLAGYAENGGRAAVERHVRAQAGAIYRVLQDQGVSCAEGERGELPAAQRIRLPPETLRRAATSCLDVAVAFASAIENLGMQPLLVVVPGHALAGVRLERGSSAVLYLDLSLLPGASFEAAVAGGRRWIERTPAEQVLAVDVSAARARGVYPLVERAATIATRVSRAEPATARLAAAR